MLKVPKDQWSFAQKFPELFLGKEALARVESEAQRATFTRRSGTLNYIERMIKSADQRVGAGGWLDFFGATIAPYRLTPWNLVGELLSYSPPIAFARGVLAIKTRNRLLAYDNASRFFIGSAMAAGGYWLYSKGITSPSLDKRDEVHKSRILSREVMPPNHINTSALGRAMAKYAKGEQPTEEDFAFRTGDDTRDFFRAGGVVGSFLYMTANVGRNQEKTPETDFLTKMGDIARQSTLEQARFGLNQSFLAGVEGFLSAARGETDGDSFFKQWIGAPMSIPLPNTMTSLSRAMRKYQVDVKDDKMIGSIGNIMAKRLGFAGLDEYLPLKRDLWGQPMLETPEGRNAIFYHLFDISKGKQVTDDPVALELYRVWRKTADTRSIPSIPVRSITVASRQYFLNPKQYERYAELIGKKRREVVEKLVVNPHYHKGVDEVKIKLLEKAWRKSAEFGRNEFLQEVPVEELEAKGKREGFKQPASNPTP